MAGISISPQGVRAAAHELRDALGDTSDAGAWPDRSVANLPIEGKASLRYYPALADRVARPLLMVYALVNRPHVLDLAPGDSFIKRLQDLGHPVYLLDWGCPDAVDAAVSLADYVCGYLRTAARLVRQRHAARRIDLLGVCQGGSLALCLASIEPRLFSRLVTVVTAVDFHTPSDVLGRMARALDLPALLGPDGNVSGRLVAGVFERLRVLRGPAAERLPLGTTLGGSREERERLQRLLMWQDDYLNQAGRAWMEWVTACYVENRLIEGGLVLAGETVDLRRLQMPVLNVYARHDHLVPVDAARALRRVVSGHQYVELEVPTGNLGVFAGRRGLAVVPTAVSTFLRSRRRTATAPGQPQ